MDGNTIGYGGGIAPRVGVMAGQPPAEPRPRRKRPAYARLRDQAGRPATIVQGMANKPFPGGAVDLNIETDAQ